MLRPPHHRLRQTVLAKRDPSRFFASSAVRPAKASAEGGLSLGGRPLRVGIVGGGPAGFYAASRLLSLPGSENVKVDLFELLPVPFGLARFGVAPDHPEVKNCEHKFEETARDSRFSFFGNVQITGDTSAATNSHPGASYPVNIPLSSLRSHYDALILTYGASLDRPLGIPGEDSLRNVLSARDFVNWYNGHPYYSSKLSPLIDLSKIEHVTLIGQGNVALDCARLLLKRPSLLHEFDVPEYALAELARSRVKRVDVVGRRGPLQLACTTKELRELMNVPGVAFEVDQALIDQAQATVDAHPEMSGARMRKRALGLLKAGSKAKLGESDKSWSLDFLRSPLELLADAAPPRQADATATPASSLAVDAPGTLPSLPNLDYPTPAERVRSISYSLNELVPPRSGDSDPLRLQARATGAVEVRQTDLVLKSVGYRSTGLAGLPFDERNGVIKNVEGRVVSDAGDVLPGLYTSGWLATGPQGVIATTLFNAFATADLVGADLAALPAAAEEKAPLPIEQLRGAGRVVSWQDWERIDSAERAAGEGKGKLREKITDVREMLAMLQ